MCRAVACVGLLFLLPSSVGRKDVASVQLGRRRRALLTAHSWLNLAKPPVWTKCDSSPLHHRVVSHTGCAAVLDNSPVAGGTSCRGALSGGQNFRCLCQNEAQLLG